MKKFTFFASISFLFLQFLYLNSSAQLRFPENIQKTEKTSSRTTSAGEKCGTMEWLNKAYEMYPNYRAQYEANEKKLGDLITQRIREQQSNRNNRTQAIITIPVVFHVVLNAAGQTSITDAKIQAQLDTLNRDFGGTNGDSTNIPAEFQAVRGHSNIQFCLAQRTPADLPTNGILRVTSNTVSNGNPGNDPIKSTVAGGSDTWDPTRYLNIWLCNFSDAQSLGYATFPPGTAEGAGIPLNQQGVAVLAQTVPGGSAAPYNKGRTLTHEAGHFFWLRHISGDASCGNDFPNTPGIDDTPQQNNLTFNCPSGAVASGCAASPSPPGRMYQNFMDYTDDACMTMFTIGQGIRAEMSITANRPSLLTSNGCVPPPAAAGNDARISAIIAPVNGSSTSCTAVTPVVTIQNMGSNTLTSATINVRLNGGAPITTAWTGSLAQGATANVTLASLPIITGSNTLKIHTTLPNGLTDANPTNDTATSVFTRISQAPLPLTHNFETEFLPLGWSLNNPDAATTWVWAGPGAGGAGGATAMDNYTYDAVGQVDDVITRVINTAGLLANDSILVNFDLAHKSYPGSSDSLKIMVSNNCGLTYTTIWERGGAELATAGSTTGFYSVPAAADWRNQRASIGQSLFGAGQIQVMFRNVNDYGNVIWVDNINVSLKPRKDLQALAIVRPNLTECISTFAPSLTVRNNGGEIVTAFKTGYILNNGTPVIQTHNISLAAGGGTATVTFPNLTAPAGTHTIKLFVADPLTVSPGPDGTPTNDTLTRTFTVPVTVTNLTEGFEGNFIPANWFLINTNNDVTWTKVTPGKNSASSAFIDNYNTPNFGRIDIMQTPVINTNGADSLVISFDVAHKNYPGSFDRLRVLVSNDCGATFTSVFNKSGTTLATAGSSTDDYITPAASDWRNEYISLNNLLLGAGTIVRFENLGDWGNNIFIDNINIAPKFKRDLELRSVSPQVFCATNVVPVATVFNRGTETITAYRVSYSIDGGPAVLTNVSTAIAPGATVNVTLKDTNTTVGVHTIKIYSWNPVAASGTGDQYIPNDTIIRSLTVVSTITTPSLTQNFESTTFPPAGWGVTNNDGNLTWQRGPGNASNGSAMVRNFTYVANKEIDRLHSPVLSYIDVDSVKLTFDVSAAARVFSGLPGNVQVDTLSVLATKDCGNTFTTIYKKWGLELQVLPIDANYPQTFEFTPGSPFYWRNESIDLTAYGAPTADLQVIFQNTSNFGNNVYVDNVNLSTKTLPANLKENGYVIYPSPFRDQFSISHWQQPTNLRYVAVYTSAGQLLFKQEFNGNAEKTINVNLAKHANGVYIVRMGYNGREDVQERILKF